MCYVVLDDVENGDGNGSPGENGMKERDGKFRWRLTIRGLEEQSQPRRVRLRKPPSLSKCHFTYAHLFNLIGDKNVFVYCMYNYSRVRTK